MVSYFAELVSAYFVENKIVPSEDRSIYKYGTEVAISSVLGVLLIISISAILGRVQDGILFLLCFIPTRVYTGGYHASTYLKCNATFISTFILILGISSILHKSPEIYISITLMLLSLITVIMLSPIKNKHKSLTSSEQKKYRKISINVSIIWIAISIILFAFDMNILSLVSLTLFSIAILMIVEKINQLKNNGGSYEQ